jgi:hypothetical protein
MQNLGSDAMNRTVGRLVQLQFFLAKLVQLKLDMIEQEWDALNFVASQNSSPIFLFNIPSILIENGITQHEIKFVHAKNVTPNT